MVKKMIVDGEELDVKKYKKEKNQKALFVQRLIAFLIDIFLVSFVASVLSTPFVDTKKTEKLDKEALEIVEKFQNKEIDLGNYVSEYTSIYYKIARNNGIISIITIFLNVLYFVVYQIYANGQTLGKKLMNIKVVSDTGELFMNQMIYRSLLANFILVDIISFIFMLVSPKSVYFYGAGLSQFIQYIIVFISIFMIMFRKDGCAIHDKLAHTRVIREK